MVLRKAEKSRGRTVTRFRYGVGSCATCRCGFRSIDCLAASRGDQILRAGDPKPTSDGGKAANPTQKTTSSWAFKAQQYERRSRRNNLGLAIQGSQVMGFDEVQASPWTRILRMMFAGNKPNAEPRATSKDAEHQPDKSYAEEPSRVPSIAWMLGNVKCTG